MLYSNDNQMQCSYLAHTFFSWNCFSFQWNVESCLYYARISYVFFFFFLISPALFQFVFSFLIRLSNSQIVLLFIITVVYRLLLFLCLCKIICVFIASQLCQVFSFSFPRAVQFLSRLLSLLWKTLTLNIFFFYATFTFSVHSCQ